MVRRQVVAEETEQDRPDYGSLWYAVGDCNRGGATTPDHLATAAQVAGKPRGIHSIPPQFAQEEGTVVDAVERLALKSAAMRAETKPESMF